MAAHINGVSRLDSFFVAMPTAAARAATHELATDALTTGIREYALKLRDLPAAQKPREKLTLHGPGALSVAELVMVVLNVGTKKEDVRAMSTRITREYGERALFTETNPETLVNELAIPLAKAYQLVACAELGRRLFAKAASLPATVRTSRDVYEYVHDMHRLPKEQLRGLYVNAHYGVIHDEIISLGTVDANLVHPREVFRPAVACGAVAVILAHNHPSGVVAPSDADVAVTQQLIAAGAIMGIKLVDHVIVSRETFASIKAPYPH